MVIKKITIILIFAFSAYTSYATVCTIMPGNMLCGIGDIDKINSNGIVKVTGTNIKGLTKVNGTFTGVDANFINLDINGTATLSQSLIEGSSIIKGTLVTVSTKFNSSIDLYTDSSTFDKTLVNGNVNIKKTSSKNQKIYLNNSSEITGDVTFETGLGEVVLSGNSKIKGNVIGGTVTTL